MNKPNIRNNIIDISSFQNELNGLFSSTGFYLKSKVIEGSHKGKNMFFNFWALLKMYIFEVVTFFSCLVFIQSTQFWFKIRVFDEAFFPLTIRMPMITEVLRVVTCCRELPPVHMHGVKQSGLVGSCDK